MSYCADCAECEAHVEHLEKVAAERLAIISRLEARCEDRDCTITILRAENERLTLLSLKLDQERREYKIILEEVRAWAAHWIDSGGRGTDFGYALDDFLDKLEGKVTT